MFEDKVKLYYQLDKLIKMQLKKKEELASEIKSYIIRDSVELQPGETITTGTGEYNIQLQVKQGQPHIDEGVLEQLLVDKNLWAEATRRQVDTSLVSQLFIEGKLTDNDLRSINRGSKVIFALKVEPKNV